MHEQHIEHEAKRLACEVVPVNGKLKRVRGGALPAGQHYVPGLRAVGSIAYASVYAQGGPARTPKGWVVEWFKPLAKRQIWATDDLEFQGRLVKADGVWVSAGRSMQGKTLEGAMNLVKASGKSYRLVVRYADGEQVVKF